MRETSNPVFRSLPKQGGGYAQFGTGLGAATAGVTQQQRSQGYPGLQGPETPYQRVDSRPLTIDDVVTKTGITLGVLSVAAIISFFMVSSNQALAGPLTFIGAFGGLAIVMVAMFTRRQDNKALVLSYAVLEGLFLGAFSWMLTAFTVGTSNAGSMIGQAVMGTLGVFGGMLVVYKTGAIRVTPKFTRMLVAGMFGVLALMIGNLVLSMFGVGGGEGLGLRSGGTMSIIFSLVCIGIAAFSFLIDFDAADQLIRAGAPEKAAWGIALGLTVTLVWLYLEILRLLSYFQSE